MEILRIYIKRMDDKLPETDDLPECDGLVYSSSPERAFEEHVLADLHLMAKQVSEIHAVLEEFRPLLNILRPGGAGTEVQRAGAVRAMRKRWVG